MYWAKIFSTNNLQKGGESSQIELCENTENGASSFPVLTHLKFTFSSYQYQVSRLQVSKTFTTDTKYVKLFED